AVRASGAVPLVHRARVAPLWPKPGSTGTLGLANADLQCDDSDWHAGPWKVNGRALISARTVGSFNAEAGRTVTNAPGRQQTHPRVGGIGCGARMVDLFSPRRASPYRRQNAPSSWDGCFSSPHL